MTHQGNAAHWLVDRHIAEGRAEKIAFQDIDAGQSLSYGDLADRSGRVAQALLTAGVRPEERALCLLHDTVDYPVILFGAMKAGVVPILLNTLLSEELYATILEDCQPRIVFVSAPLWPMIAQKVGEMPGIAHVVIVGGASMGGMGFADFLADAAPMSAAPVSPDACAFWLYSSGSTGQPKGVRHVHSALRACAETYGAQVLGIREDDVVLSAAKIFFAYGLGNSVTFPLSVGATTLLFPGRPTPGDMIRSIAAHRPTIFYGVPTLYAAMVAALEADGAPEHALRLCVSAGEALPSEIGTRWEALMDAQILDGVGSTEMLHIFLSNAQDSLEYGTSGLAVPGYDLRLVDEAGSEVPPDTIGELLVRGASAADGYWNQRVKSRATFEGEWTRTGDKYERRADGRYVYCGRTDDMFKVGGIWVSPFEVEQAIITHDAVLEAAVVPAMDGDGLEKPKAFVVLKETAAAAGFAEDLKPFVQNKIGKWKYPRWVEVVEDLPKTATGKIQRFKLRA